jgi:hypothetical protein
MVTVAVVVAWLLAVAAKAGVGVAVVLARARAVGSSEDNSSNSNVRGPYNNQLNGPVEGTTAAAMSVALAFSVCGGDGLKK